MYLRLLCGILVLSLTAFAPAPIVKPDRKKDRNQGDTLARLQGTWSITSKQRMSGGNLTNYSTTQKLAINKDSWQFTSGVNGAKVISSLSYKIEVEPTTPRQFRVKRTLTTSTRDYMVGIVVVEGDTAKMLYRLASISDEQPIPTRFDTVPEGWYLMTLKREK